MKLREAIKNIPDDDWLEITENTSDRYKSTIGRAPKKYITGEVLDYEVLDSIFQRKKDYNLHRLLVNDNRKI